MELTANEWGKYLQNVIWIDNIPWEMRNKTLLPIAMPHTIKNLDRKKISEAINSYKSLLAAWTDNWDSKESEWWWTVCDAKDYDLENISNRIGRRDIRKGLSNCIIKKISATYFLENSYEIFFNAQKSYGADEKEIITKNDYKRMIGEQSKYDGLEFWGAFIGDRLVAFSTCLVADEAVSLTTSKSNPIYHKAYPNNALFYSLTKHYLVDRGYKYVTNGPRTLLHPTTINDLLIRMGFKRVYARLNIELSDNVQLINKFSVGTLIQKMKFLKYIFPKQYNKMSAFNNLIEISRSFEPND